jgi:hypothetical protein
MYAVISSGVVLECARGNPCRCLRLSRRIQYLCIFSPVEFDPHQQTITLANVTIEPVIVLALASDQSDLFKGHDNDNSG